MASSDDGGAVDVELIGKSYFCIFLFKILEKRIPKKIIRKGLKRNSKEILNEFKIQKMIPNDLLSHLIFPNS